MRLQIAFSSLRICNTIWIRICFYGCQKIQTFDILFLLSISQKNIVYFKANMLSRVEFWIETMILRWSVLIKAWFTILKLGVITSILPTDRSEVVLPTALQRIMKLLLLNLICFLCFFLSALICWKFSSRFRFKELR